MTFWRRSEEAYLHPHRLADVLALIQVLGFYRDAHRSENGLQSELQGFPRSAPTWDAVASDHPEFFRVTPPGDDKTPRVSLIARHGMRRDPQLGDKVPPLEASQVDSLINAAVEMHDRQVRRRDRWTYLVPVWVALIAAVASLGPTLVRLYSGVHSR